MTETTYSLTRWIELDKHEVFYWVGAAGGICATGAVTAVSGFATSVGLAVAGLVGVLVCFAVLYNGGEA